MNVCPGKQRTDGPKDIIDVQKCFSPWQGLCYWKKEGNIFGRLLMITATNRGIHLAK
jgi:hypothetical protein